MNVDDAIRFLTEYLKNPRNENLGGYGYEIYVPSIIGIYLRVVEGDSDPHAAQGKRARELSPIFYEAGWELSRRGIFRPGIRDKDAQATADGSSGNGYCLTTLGREWLERTEDLMFIPTDPSRFGQLISRFQPRFGDVFLQRAQEAAKCYSALTYLACCAMCGAATESILLSLAIEKTKDENQTLKIYYSSGGRGRIEKIITGNTKEQLANQFRRSTDLIKYWRDEASHGGPSDISEFEAYQALTHLLRFAHFADDHWGDIIG